MRSMSLVAAVLFLVFIVGPLFGQTAAQLDEILAEKHLSYGSAAYLLLGVSDEEGEPESREAATETLEARGLHLPEMEADARLNLGELSLLIMRVLEIDGGFMYRLLEDPRYAARELEFLGVIQGNAFPRMRVSGERGLRILNRAVALREEGQL